MKPRVACIVGTRPEATKLAPLINRWRASDSRVEPVVVGTGQHVELVAGALADFNLAVDRDLRLFRPGSTLAENLAHAIAGLDAEIAELRPQFVVAQGDTTSVLAAGLASFCRRVPFAHVEAGLRTHDFDSPFPEERNRVLVAKLARLHFAPTGNARDNLVREGIDPSVIRVTGNTAIDAVWTIAERVSLSSVTQDPAAPFLLVTAHRRENFGLGIERLRSALEELIRRIDEMTIVISLHTNPAAREPFVQGLGGLERVKLIEPPGYADFVGLMLRAQLILTDSGGIQEEAPALGKRVLVFRDKTERPEGLETGLVELVGAAAEGVIAGVLKYWQLMGADSTHGFKRFPNPYGDGKASVRIAAAVDAELGLGLADELDDFVTC